MFRIKEKTIALALFFISLISIPFLIRAQPWISLTFDFSTINFGSLQVDTTNNPAENNYQINVSSGDGCVGQVTFYSPSQPLSNGSYTIPNSNFKFNYTINTTAYPTLLTLDTNRIIDVNNADEVYPEYYLDISSQQYAGHYNTTHTIEGSCI